jgi:hypothetical protein
MIHGDAPRRRTAPVGVVPHQCRQARRIISQNSLIHHAFLLRSDIQAILLLSWLQEEPPIVYRYRTLTTTTDAPQTLDLLQRTYMATNIESSPKSSWAASPHALDVATHDHTTPLHHDVRARSCLDQLRRYLP